MKTEILFVVTVTFEPKSYPISPLFLGTLCKNVEHHRTIRSVADNSKPYEVRLSNIVNQSKTV